ncbi:unnamed protein product, partial [Arabidopsis halleri]
MSMSEEGRTQIVDLVVPRPPDLQWSSSSWPSNWDYSKQSKTMSFF